MSETRVRRISRTSSQRIAAVSQARTAIDPVVGSVFTSVCATVLLGALLMAILLAMRSGRPVPAYALFGSALFGFVFASFLVGALHLALTDSRRETGEDH